MSDQEFTDRMLELGYEAHSSVVQINAIVDHYIMVRKNGKDILRTIAQLNIYEHDVGLEVSRKNLEVYNKFKNR